MKHRQYFDAPPELHDRLIKNKNSHMRVVHLKLGTDILLNLSFTFFE